MTKRFTFLAPILTVACAVGLGIPRSGPAADQKEPFVREILVPFEDLNVLLEGQPQRVMLSREAYESLLEKARLVPESRPPRETGLLSAAYLADVDDQRARLTGTLVLEVLEDGLYGVPLDLSGVGLRGVTLDGQPAPIGRGDGGRPTLFVEGKGRHQLVLDMVAPVETTAATQVLRLRLPRPPATTLALTVPGDVEVKSGAAVASREVDEAAGVTRFQLLPGPGEMTLVMTLNSRLQRRERAVVASSVLVDEVTEAYERLHATVSLRVLHRAVDGFRFVVPDAFEVTQVAAPQLARWAVETEGSKRVLDVRLREQTAETVVLSLSAVRTAPALDRWSFPKLEPLDVVGQSAVVGLLVDQRLQAESVASAALVPIDTAVLNQALPETVFRAEPGAPALRSVVAYYAPQAEFELSARFTRPPVETAVTTNVLLLLKEQDQQVRGEFFLVPEAEKLFALDFSVPPAWHVTSVTTPDGKPLEFERYGEKDKAGRIHVRLARGVEPGQEYRLFFNATSVPPGWLGAWESIQVEFPVFAVAGAARDTGAVAVEAPDGEMDLTLQTQENLTPLDAAQREQYGLAETSGRVLAFRYEGHPYRAAIQVKRTRPRLTARTFSFLGVESDSLAAHYEVVYQVEEARVRQLDLLLPKETPTEVSIVALDGVGLKQFDSSEAEGLRRWTALLDEPRRGTIRLAVDFRQPFPEPNLFAPDQAPSEPDQKLKAFGLPIIAAGGVVYQSGVVAVEGDSELEVQVKTKARPVDVGELADAKRQPGRGLLGVFGFAGDSPKVAVDVFRREGHRLYPTIVQSAKLRTRLSAVGDNVTAAQFKLRTKAVYLEVELPPDAQLWAAELDDKPVKPQREDQRLLVSLPAASGSTPRALRLVYWTPADPAGSPGSLSIPAPKLWLRADRGARVEAVPIADLQWRLYPPPGYEVIRSKGTVVTILRRPEPAILNVAKAVGKVLFLSPTLIVARGHKDWLPSAYLMQDDSGFVPEGEIAPAERLERHPQRYLAIDEEGGAAAREGPRYGQTEDRGGRVRGEETADEDAAGYEEAEASEDESMGAARPMPEGKPKVPDSFAAPPPPQPAVPTLTPNAEPAAEPAKKLRRFEGFRSLKIDLERMPEDAGAVTFQSLGVEPRLAVTLGNRPRRGFVAWAVALAVGLVGLALTRRSVRAKTWLVLAVLVLGTIVPSVPGLEPTAEASNLAVYAASLLVPYYLLAGCLRRFARLLRRRVSPAAAAAATTTALILIGLSAITTVDAAEAQSRSQDGRFVVQVVEPPEPVSVPEDAVILPYDPQSPTGIEDADQLLVPYAKYVELWNRAYPDQKLQARKPPAEYGLSGASYRATLAGDEYLLVEGNLEIDVYTDQYATVPLGLGGGVLARAELDGKPARLSVVQVEASGAAGQEAAQQTRQQTAPSPPPEQAAGPDRALVVLHVSGKGRHRLDLAVRLRLERRGGWRVAEGVLPSAPATALSLVVPDIGTEVRLGHVLDRRSYESKQAGQTIDTALGPQGAVSIQWRPKVGEGQIDRSLTVQSTAVLDVQEDGLRLVWQLAFAFPRSQRDAFTVQVPEGYLVDRVEGANVRGWEVRRQDGRQTLEITLLKTARDSERFAIHLGRWGRVGQGELAQFDVPVVSVPDAAMHNGQLTIRRSPLLDLRTESTSGVKRDDLSAEARGRAPGWVGTDQSPLGIQSYETYAFAAVPFSVRVAAVPAASQITAEVQTVLKIAEFERSLESQVTLNVQQRPIHRVELFPPDGLDLENVSAPGDFQWAVTRQDNRALLTVYLCAGRQGEVPVQIGGRLARKGATDPLPLPGLEVVGVGRQSGEFAVQVDPAFDVEAADLGDNCETVLRSRLDRWLSPGQRQATRLALSYEGADYRGTLHFRPRQPIVSCKTITNVLVTDRAVEETVLLDFTIERAGIRQVEILLPHWMKDCPIDVPMLRQKTDQPVGEGDESPRRVTLLLQDDVMGELRVLVQNDRPLEPKPYTAPIPVVRTGRTDRQAVVLQNAGRDELVVNSAQLTGLEPLRREQSGWEELREMFGGITRAYRVTGEAAKAVLPFSMKERIAVETARARIGLAQANLVVDPTGAYRAEQIYRLHNTTEQFLVVELPEEARLWTATVAGRPTKPTKVPGAKDDRQVRIPLVKTAPGDLDYAVVLKYGGRMPAPGTLGAAWSPVSFPLVRKVSLKVEQSQVRLRLPESYRWFDFGGTMGLVPDEQDLVADFAAYQTKQGKRLLETMQQSGWYARQRAAGNIKRLGTALYEYQDSWKDMRRSKRLQEEYGKNVEMLQQAQQQLDKLDQILEKPPVFDNRDRLNTLFEGQKTTRARNVVQELGPNWTRPVNEPPETSQQPSQFNPFWLKGNKLSRPVEGKKADEIERLPRGGDKRRLEPGKGARQPARGPASGKTRFQQERSATEGRPSSVQGQERLLGQAKSWPADRPMPSSSYDASVQFGDWGALGTVPGDAAGRRRHFAVTADGDRAVGGVDLGLTDGSVSMITDGSSLTAAIAQRVAPGGAEGVSAGVAAPGPGIGTALPTGLASLDVALPTRGVTYRFTTPGGEVEITARAVPNELLRTLSTAGLTLVGLVAALLLIRLVRRGSFGWLARPFGSWCLIVVGLVVFLIFPVIGLAALVSGIWMTVCRVIARRSSARTSPNETQPATAEPAPG